MRVVVCVPWRSTPEREPIWRYVQKQFARFGDLIVGDTPAETFNVAAASNQAIREAGDWDVMVYTGADCVLAERRQVWEAIELAADGAFVAAHDEIRFLTEQATRMILTRRRSPRESDPFEYSTKLAWEGTRVIGRPLWDRCGGFDERITSGEGLAFSWSCGTLALEKQVRVPGVLYHLWHPYRPHRWSENKMLVRRYHEAAGNPEAIKTLLGESAEARGG